MKNSINQIRINLSAWILPRYVREALISGHEHRTELREAIRSREDLADIEQRHIDASSSAVIGGDPIEMLNIITHSMDDVPRLLDYIAHLHISEG